MKPRAFISYSWTTPGHKDNIRSIAERLMSDGVDIVLDIWELKEGDDKYAFMEKMVLDETVTHVLIFSDLEYANKANARKAGVGTESQIISQEIYARIKQSKFIPIVCTKDDNNEPHLPTFLKGRIWIDFSNSEAINENWEQLLRVLYDKPAFVKPALGKTPAHIFADNNLPMSPAESKFVALKQALLQNKSGLKHYRRDFLDICYNIADELRIREEPVNLAESILDVCRKLKPVRDCLTDWILLEAEINPNEEFGEAIINILERLIELKFRTPELKSWNNKWFEAHVIFVYEAFLYIVAALMKSEAFDIMNLVFKNRYLLPSNADRGSGVFKDFGIFYGYSDVLQILAPQGKKLLSPAAELIKRQADKKDVPFDSIIQAELLILMMAFINPDCRWRPQTFYYASNVRVVPFFLRASQHRYFMKLAKVTGISDADELREFVRKGHERLGVNEWHDFWLLGESFWSIMNMDNMDTI